MDKISNVSRGEIAIYQTKDKKIDLEVKLQKQTVWLTQKLIAKLFQTDRSVITKHLRNIFKSKELDKESVCAKFAHTAEDGKVYKTAFYSLDAIISIGYPLHLTLTTAPSNP